MRIAHVLALVLGICALVPSVSRADDPKGWVGALGGLSVPNQDDASSRMLFGITAGAKLGSEFGLGGYILTASKDEGGALGRFTYEMYGVEGSYHFEGEAVGAYFAARLGTSKVKAGGVSKSPMHYGVAGGYNYFLGDHFSVGGEVGFFSIQSADKVDGFTMLNFLGSAKFWF